MLNGDEMDPDACPMNGFCIEGFCTSSHDEIRQKLVMEEREKQLYRENFGNFFEFGSEFTDLDGGITRQPQNPLNRDVNASCSTNWSIPSPQSIEVANKILADFADEVEKKEKKQEEREMALLQSQIDHPQIFVEVVSPPEESILSMDLYSYMMLFYREDHFGFPEEKIESNINEVATTLMNNINEVNINEVADLDNTYLESYRKDAEKTFGDHTYMFPIPPPQKTTDDDQKDESENCTNQVCESQNVD